MKKLFKATAIIALGLAGSALAAGCGDDDDFGADATLTIDNQSDFVIEEIRIARTDANEPFGPNLIPAALFPDETVTIGFDCGFFDVLLVDELGAECELLNLNLCFEDAIWVITNAQLASCDQFAARLEAMGETP